MPTICAQRLCHSLRAAALAYTRAGSLLSLWASPGHGAANSSWQLTLALGLQLCRFASSGRLKAWLWERRIRAAQARLSGLSQGACSSATACSHGGDQRLLAEGLAL